MAEAYLESDMEWFEKNRQQLLAEYRCQWAVIFHQQLLGVFPTFSEAFREGTARTGSTNILIQPILDVDEPVDACSIGANLVDIYA